jgi:hypothetical protein
MHIRIQEQSENGEIPDSPVARVADTMISAALRHPEFTPGSRAIVLLMAPHLTSDGGMPIGFAAYGGNDHQIIEDMIRYIHVFAAARGFEVHAHVVAGPPN